MVKKEDKCCGFGTPPMGGLILVLIGGLLVLERYVPEITFWPWFLIALGLIIILKNR